MNEFQIGNAKNLFDQKNFNYINDWILLQDNHGQICFNIFIQLHKTFFGENLQISGLKGGGVKKNRRINVP